MKSIIIRLIPIFVVINYFWNLIPIQSLPDLLKIVIGDFIGPIVILSLFITLSLKFIWKIPIIGYLFRWLFNTNVPLYGSWLGEIEYEFENKKKSKKVFLVIKQPDALKINILFYSDERESTSDSASIINKNGRSTLIYTYKTEDMIKNKEKNPLHSGTAVLRIDASPRYFKLNGEYYSTRKTVGSMTFLRKSKKVSDSYKSIKKICGL